MRIITGKEIIWGILHLFFDYSSIVPVENSNSTCVKGAGFDNDGDIDLFVGGGPIPFKYPYSDSSYLLENLSSNYELKFKNSNSFFTSADINISFIFFGVIFTFCSLTFLKYL